MYHEARFSDSSPPREYTPLSRLPKRPALANRTAFMRIRQPRFPPAPDWVRFPLTAIIAGIKFQIDFLTELFSSQETIFPTLFSSQFSDRIGLL